MWSLKKYSFTLDIIKKNTCITNLMTNILFYLSRYCILKFDRHLKVGNLYNFGYMSNCDSIPNNSTQYYALMSNTIFSFFFLCSDACLPPKHYLI